MDRKIIIAVLSVLLCICGFSACTAYAETTQDYTEDNTSYPVSVLSVEEQAELYALQEQAYQGTISTTYVTFFRDIASTLPVTHDYVMLRTGDNVYKMYSGDFINEGENFYMQGEGYVHTINYITGSGYGNYYYDYSVSPTSDVTLSADGMLIYSNLGGYPSLTERSASIEYALFIAVFSMCIAFVLHSIFKFILRDSQSR